MLWITTVSTYFLRRKDLLFGCQKDTITNKPTDLILLPAKFQVYKYANYRTACEYSFILH